MKTSEIASKYSIDEISFNNYLQKNKLLYKESLWGSSIFVDDNLVEGYVNQYKSFMAEKIAKETAEKEAAAAEKRAKDKAMREILISSGFSFEGYRIVKYSGYISGDDATEMPRSGTFNKLNNGENITQSLVKIRRVALKELKEAAYNLGCNAVIGVDFDYLTLEPESWNVFTGRTDYEPYIICVTANGNAVVIEPIDKKE